MAKEGTSQWFTDRVLLWEKRRSTIYNFLNNKFFHSGSYLSFVSHGSLATDHDFAACVLFQLFGRHPTGPQYPTHKVELWKQSHCSLSFSCDVCVCVCARICACCSFICFSSSDWQSLLQIHIDRNIYIKVHLVELKSNTNGQMITLVNS